MNQAILMTGLVLSIAVLTTGSILPSVAAIKPGVDDSTGFKIQCKTNGNLICKASSHDGVSQIIITRPNASSSTTTDNSCPRSLSNAFNINESGDYTVTVKGCGGSPESNFAVNIQNGKITGISVISP